MILTRNADEISAAWIAHPELRTSYRTQNEFMEYCAKVNEDCERLGRTPFGSSAIVRAELDDGVHIRPVATGPSRASE